MCVVVVVDRDRVVVVVVTPGGSCWVDVVRRRKAAEQGRQKTSFTCAQTDSVGGADSLPLDLDSRCFFPCLVVCVFFLSTASVCLFGE